MHSPLSTQEGVFLESWSSSVPAYFLINYMILHRRSLSSQQFGRNFKTSLRVSILTCCQQKARVRMLIFLLLQPPF